MSEIMRSFLRYSRAPAAAALLALTASCSALSRGHELPSSSPSSSAAESYKGSLTCKNVRLSAVGKPAQGGSFLFHFQLHDSGLVPRGDVAPLNKGDAEVQVDDGKMQDASSFALTVGRHVLVLDIPDLTPCPSTIVYNQNGVLTAQS